MDLDFTEEQEMLREMVRNFCTAYSPLDTVRALEDDAIGFSSETWKQMAALDLIGLMLPEEYGGSGMGALEGALLYSELGRALVPSPHFVSAVLAASVLLQAASDEQKREWLARIASGDAIVTIAWLEPDGGYGVRGVQTRATANADGFVLDGIKRHVQFAKAATALIVLARNDDENVDMFLVDAADTGLTQQLALGSDTQYEVRFASTPAQRIGAAGTGWDTWQRVMMQSIVFIAAQAVGGARYALDITVQYAKDRVQFDKPLGAFQAIAHYLADAVTVVDGAEVLVWEAAWSLANDRPVDRLAPMAKLFACKTFRDVTAMAQQVFGGVGFTVDYDIQLFFRRAKQLQLSWWDDRTLEQLIADAVVDDVSRKDRADS
jgi:alkylation response protein AidB-like acyl-CoA dehydrogenase